MGEEKLAGALGEAGKRKTRLARANSWAETLLSARTWPLAKLVALAGACIWWLFTQYATWTDKRQSAIAEGMFYPPIAMLYVVPNVCELTNRDSRDIAEASLDWRIYVPNW